MFYKIDLTIPPLTSYLSPVETKVRVFPGMVRRVWVMFPPGPKGLAHVTIYHWGWQVWPWAPGTDFAWDNFVYTFEDRYPLTAEPLEFVMKGWSDDDFYPHTISFAVTVDPAPKQTELLKLHRTLEALGLVQGGL